MRTALVPFVTTPAVKATSGTSIVSASFTPNAGDYILLGLQYTGGTATITTTVTDSQGNTWTQIAAAGSSDTGKFRVLVARVSAGTAMTVTVTFSAAITGVVATFTTIRGGQLLNASIVSSLRVSGTSQAITLAYPSAVLDGNGQVPVNCLSVSVFGTSSTSGAVAPTSDAAYTQLANDGQVLASLVRNQVEEDYCSVNVPASMTWTTSASGVGEVSAAVAALFVPNPGPDPRVLSRAVPVSTW